MKNFRKILILCFAAILLGGCSASYDGGSSEAMRANFEAEMATGAEFEYYSFDTDYAAMPMEVMEVSAERGAAGANLPIDRKIIRDAQITMESEEVENAYENILAILSGLGGYEADRNMYNNAYGYPTVNATLKVPAGNLDMFLATIKEEGEVKSSNISSSDISDQYFDAQIRLDTLEQTLENYKRYLENAESVEEQLEVTRYINDTTYEIEQLKGSLRRWDSLVEYSTVTFYLYPINAAPEEPRVIEWDSLSLEDMGWFISSGFLGVCNAIFSVLQWLVISIAAISPILAVLAVLIFLLVRRHKKNKKKKLLQWQQAQAQMQAQNQNQQP